MYNQITANKRKSFFLIFFFMAFVLALGWFFGEYFDYGYGAVVFAGMIAVFMTLTSYFAGDKIALTASGAHPIKKEDNPYVYRMVENLAIATGIPTPKVYMINDPAMNAFATGRDYQHASIAVTTGIIDALENEELEGVIAHELSHIKNYDVRVMMLVAVLAGVIVLLSDILFRAHLFGGRRSDDNRAGGAIAIIGLVLLILSPVFAQLIKLAVSRKREFLADASGALLTRYPEGLARALEKIGAQNRPLNKASNATAHLFISNPFGAHTGKALANLFSTHPPIEERVKALRSMGT